MELCGTDVTGAAVSAFDYVNVVDVVGICAANSIVVAFVRVLSNSTCTCVQNDPMSALSS